MSGVVTAVVGILRRGYRVVHVLRRTTSNSITKLLVQTAEIVFQYTTVYCTGDSTRSKAGRV